MRAPVFVVLLFAGFCMAGTASLAADDQPDAAPNPQLVVQGKSLFAQMCSHCHGVNMVNPGTSSFDLRKFPHDDKARFVDSVTHGKNTMPAWGDILQPDEIEALWAYIRTGSKT